MAHYRAVMATTIDCEGCKFDGDECSSDEGCIVLDVQRNSEPSDKHSEPFDKPSEDIIEDWLRKHKPWMFK